MNIEQQSKIFDKQAKMYAKRSKKNAKDAQMRQKLLSTANGNILELSVGAGVNFHFYPKNSHLTAVDFSAGMIEQAKVKATELGITNCNFIVENVEELELPVASFDTVVSTLCMCSYPNPELVLEKMARWCKPGGQILLYEHGISSNSILAWVQKQTDPFWVKTIGCHQNRDILKLVRNSPISVEKTESFFFNSGHLIWAKV